MRRRDVIIALTGAVAAWPSDLVAQSGTQLRRIGVLSMFAEGDPEGQATIAAFRQALENLGWSDGRNVRLAYRWAAADGSRMAAHAAELIALKPAVILASTPPALAALQQQTRAIPIVFVQVADPVEAGLVANFAAPGGNITGITNIQYSLGPKWLELLKEIAPSIRQVAVLLAPDHVTNAGLLRTINAAIPKIHVQLTTFRVRDATEIRRAIVAFAREPNAGLVVLPNPVTHVHRSAIVLLAAQHRLPAIYPYRFYVSGGGLMSFGAEFLDQYRRAAFYVDRILRGAKPTELPVEQPTKFELVINLKTAKALGLSVPRTLLARADEVIE